MRAPNENLKWLTFFIVCLRPAPAPLMLLDYIAILNTGRESVYLCKCKVNQHAARARLPKLCARLGSALSAK